MTGFHYIFDVHGPVTGDHAQHKHLSFRCKGDIMGDNNVWIDMANGYYTQGPFFFRLTRKRQALKVRDTRDTTYGPFKSLTMGGKHGKDHIHTHSGTYFSLWPKAIFMD